MIKINSFLYMHIATVLLFAVCYINRNLEMLAVSYSSIFLHELAHLVAATCIGLRCSHIVMYPFGVNLKLKNSIVYSLTDEIILYISGPLTNAILSLVSAFFMNNGPLWPVFYWNNLTLFLFNLLPIMPMDGGIILNKIISRRFGARAGERIMRYISIVMIVIIAASEAFLIIISKFNFSLVFICVFLIGNIFTSKEKYHLDYAKEIMYYKQKDNFKIKKIKGILIKNDADYKDVVKNFSMGSTYIIFKEDKCGRIDEILTERQIIENIMS